MTRPGAGVLAVMPLHTLSEVHGAAGLRERLLVEFGALPDSRLPTRALELASDLHREDRYGREPYLSHLLRVAIRIISHYEVRDPEVVAAGLLHDAVEDHPAELAAGRPGPAAAAALDELADRFGSRVAEIVAAVTNPPRDPTLDRHTQYRENVAAKLDRAPWARVVKLSDFTDNGVGILYAGDSHMHRLATKYRPLTNVYRDLVTRPDTPLAEHVKQHILGQLDLADERFAAILDN
ncbi:HD domain-containing protein [Nocardia panacis]|uniref:HD domain-containing protein n=1 Tax=Nocardia panacis TaxID=2340916 RepID=A0A3A4K6P9_9NOCA|nr:HD domain-containing protein [Nocardia panacis]RJO68349.1 HD domain-containing protein [Nocardia panacis]